MAEEIQQLSHRLKEEILVGVGLEGTHMHPCHFVYGLKYVSLAWLTISFNCQQASAKRCQKEANPML